MDDHYDRLPEAIRQYVSRREYAWLSDAEKQRIQEDLTSPDDDAEDRAR